MFVVSIYALTMPPKPFFERKFTRESDAQDYADFWTKLGHCHIRRTTK
jgi:hypothetical protein